MLLLLFWLHELVRLPVCIISNRNLRSASFGWMSQWNDTNPEFLEMGDIECIVVSIESIVVSIECIAVILCVIVVLCVYCCFYFRCRTAG
jgi:hypothetical protein